MHGGSCTIRTGGIQCIGRITTSKIGSTTGTTIVQHRTSTAAVDTVIGTFAATKAVTRAAVRGTAAVIVVASIDATMIKETDTGAMMWAKLLVAIIVVLRVLQTGVCGSTTSRSRTAIIGSPGRQCDHRALYFTTTVIQSS